MDALREDVAAKKVEWLGILDDATGSGIYRDRVEKMVKANKVRLVIDINELRRTRPQVTKTLLESPMVDQLAAQQALKEVVDTVSSTYSKENNGTFFVGFEGNFGAQHVTPRGLSAHLLGKMVCIDGIVSKCSLIHPKVVKSVHYCPETKKTLERSYRDATSLEGNPTIGLYPKQDDAGNALVTEYGLSVYKNHQRLTIQEMPERAPTGQLPRSVEVIVDDDLVDACKPGDRVQIVGIYRSLPSKNGGSTSGIFRTVLIANMVKQLGKEQLMPTLTETDIKNIHKIARAKRRPAFDLLSESLAPSIYGHKHIKEGLLCMLLGGEERNLRRGGHIRGDINILMVGDPSCGKSQLLRFVQNTAPHVITTTGRGSSGVGLTAAVTTDSETGDRRLEAGAMVLADRGIVCIDEFDKMSDLDRVAIHEVMEQQTVTIAKAGIHTSLNARCSVLAAANPVYGQYNPFQTPMNNIGLPDSLLSRFDLLFIVLDKMEPEIDSALATHVLRSHTYRAPGEADGQAIHVDTAHDVIVAEAPEEEQTERTSVYAKHVPGLHGKRASRDRLLSIDFVKKYIMYAKARVHPVLSAEAGSFISQAYSELRSKEADTKTLPVTARTLETMIRLSTAIAKVRLSETVDEEDARAAMDLINFAYYNEAKPVKHRRGRKGKDMDLGDSDSEPSADEASESEEDDDDDQPPAPTSGRSARSTKTSKSQRPRKQDKRKTTDADGEDETQETAVTDTQTTADKGTPRVKRLRRDVLPAPSRRPRKLDTQESSAKTDATESMDLTQDEPEPAAVDDKRVQAFEKALLAVFNAIKTKHMSMSDLKKALEEKGHDFTDAEVEGALAKMGEDEKVFVSGEQIFLM